MRGHHTNGLFATFSDAQHKVGGILSYNLFRALIGTASNSTF